MTKAKKEQQVKQQDKHMLDLANYYKWRDRLLTLSASQRARECGAWGYFSLFYWGLKSSKPNEDEWREKVYTNTAEWFEQHPEWGKPSFDVFINMLNLNKDDVMGHKVMMIISRIEDRELQDIEETKHYEAHKQYEESFIEKQEDEINPTDLF